MKFIYSSTVLKTKFEVLRLLLQFRVFRPLLYIFANYSYLLLYRRNLHKENMLCDTLSQIKLPSVIYRHLNTPHLNQQ